VILRALRERTELIVGQRKQPEEDRRWNHDGEILYSAACT
jgi:hypothetical protein